MRISLRAALLGAFLGLCAMAPTADAAQLKSVKVTTAASIPAIRPSWPVPREPNQLFYLQRSSNSNTVVYTSIFDGDGNLKTKRPAQAYWRRYNTDGARKGLKKIEQRFAYGLNIKSRGNGEYNVSLKPLPQLQMVLRQTGTGKAEVVGKIGGRDARVVYAFVSLDESGMIPKVTALSLHGIDLANGSAISEVFSVSGGAINQ